MCMCMYIDKNVFVVQTKHHPTLTMKRQKLIQSPVVKLKQTDKETPYKFPTS